MSRCYDIALNIKMRYLEEIPFQHFALLKENVETMGLLDTAFALSFKILYLDRRLSDYPKLQPPPCNCYVTFLRTLWKILRSFQQRTNFIAQRHQLRKELVKITFFFSVPFLLAFVQNWMICIVSYKASCNNLIKISEWFDSLLRINITI